MGVKYSKHCARSLRKEWQINHVAQLIHKEMPYSKILKRRARQLEIDINDPTGYGFLLVCMRMLEGLRVLLGTNPEDVLVNIKVLEEELREIANALEEIQSTSMATTFIGNGYIASLDRILLGVNEAHNHIFAVIRILRKGGSDYDISAHLKSCRSALTRILREFCIQ